MRTLIITGASYGIGKDTAIALSDMYEYIALISRDTKGTLDETGDIIRKSGALCHIFKGDVSDYEFIRRAVSTVYSETGRIDALINNAGISTVGLLTDTTPDMWNTILSTNLTSVYNTCHNVIPYMVKEHSGTIINISSVWGLVGASCEVAYSATKGGINSFTKALAKELAPSNISVNAIAFGAVDTSMNAHLEPEEKEYLENEIPYGRMATTKEAAACIKTLLKMPPYFTGEVVKFDGGWI